MDESLLSYSCPDCICPLTEDFFCDACGKTVGRLIDGIPCFTDPTYYWGEIPEQDMRRLNAEARAKGWEASLKGFIRTPEQLDYICSLERADFKHLWNLPRTARVLDVGAGLGAITAALSLSYPRVTAVEGVLERARFIQTRTQQAGNNDVKVICADFLRIPLAAGQFDVAVLNGVLEWSALKPTGNPREVQLRFLRRIRDLVKPGGLICIGIENRIGWAFIRGGIDHSGLPYTSLLPRSLASLVCRRVHGGYRSDVNAGGYRTYTYTLPGYRRLFREAGLGDMRTFHAWEGYNKPKTLLELEDRTALVWFASHFHCAEFGSENRRRVARLVARLGIWAQLASNYYFLVERP